MTDDSKEIKIYVDIVNGYSKAQSRVKLTPELEAIWDETEAWVKKVLEQNPEAILEITSEWPDAYEPRG